MIALDFIPVFPRAPLYPNLTEHKEQTHACQREAKHAGSRHLISPLAVDCDAVDRSAIASHRTRKPIDRFFDPITDADNRKHDQAQKHDSHHHIAGLSSPVVLLSVRAIVDVPAPRPSVSATCKTSATSEPIVYSSSRW